METFPGAQTRRTYGKALERKRMSPRIIARKPLGASTRSVIVPCRTAGEPRAVVIEPEERYHSVDIAVAGNPTSDPSAPRKDVMRVSLAFLNKLRSNRDRKREIRETTAVQVSELSSSDAKLDAAISMR
jgi:hypothetical protein